MYLVAPGEFRIAQADNEGAVYVTVGPVKGLVDLGPRAISYYENRPPSIARIDTTSIAAAVRRLSAQKRIKPDTPAAAPTWNTKDPDFSYLTNFWLYDGCSSPQGLAVDSRDRRLFVACENQAMLVLDSARGAVLDSLTIGPGADAIAWDENHSLIFTANGGGYGSLSVVFRHETDTYAVIQNLPTMERARTLAVDPTTGQVYLVTDLHGAKLDDPPAYGIGALKLTPVTGSFQMLVVGN